MSITSLPSASTATDPPPPETADLPDSELTVVGRRHPWRWVGVAVILVLLAMFVHGLITNPGWEWPTFFQFFTTRTIFSALWVTIRLTVYGTVLGFVPGAVIASMRLSRSPFLQVVSWGYIWAFRSIPLIVQLLFWFNIAYLYQELSLGIPFGPEFVHFSTNDLFGPLGAAVLGLALHQAAYAAEIIRGGIISVDQGSWKPLPRWGFRGSGSSSGSCCRRRCARSCRTRRTR
ncbi:ABC transporter permease subunit [Kribbella qitaiheensis]|uniref:ABC transporter permease subunit n=1 Tax=Kribbella qitaiheensis TaxID=1544730 RepID=UPI001FE7B1CB|nr:ABC transporter permease subunit [Kribbella qitaiheensis]